MRPSVSVMSAGAGTILLAAVTFSPVTPANATDISVPIDQARILKLREPGTGIVVGNPSIADVSVQNGRMLIVTGKTHGITNVIVLNGKGRQILSSRVSVSRDARRIVTVYKGPEQHSYRCVTASTCRPALLPGDTETFFEPLAKATRNKLGIAQSVLEGGQAPQ